MLWLWDAAAVLIFDPDSAVVKKLGSFTVPTASGSSGSVVDTRLTAYPGNVGFWARTDSNQPTPLTDPVVWISGNNVNWSWPTATRTSYKVLYGIK